MVYLICFKEHYHHAKHYIGFAERSVEDRLERHKAGQGAKLLRALNQAGIEYEVVRVWEDGDRNFERQLKNHKNSKKFCPRCNDASKASKGTSKKSSAKSS